MSAYPHALVGDDKELVKLITVMVEHRVEPRDPLLDEGCAQAQVDDAGAGLALAEDQLAEIAIVSDEDPPLAVGDGQHLGIGKARAVMLRHKLRIVPTRLEVGGQAGIGALVEQEPHPRAAPAADAARRPARRGVASSFAWA